MKKLPLSKKELIRTLLRGHFDLIELTEDFRCSLDSYKKNKLYAEEMGVSEFSKSKCGFGKNPKKDEIFFILGGGASINSLTTEDWGLIGENTSLGLNSWFVHEFIPDFLMIEGFRNRDIGSELYKWKVSELIKYISVSKSKIILKDLNKSALEWSTIANTEPRKIFSVSYLSVPGKSNEQRDKAMRILRGTGLAKRYPIFSRVSVTLAMSIGQRLGFKKIVLCGVDLNDGYYFWEKGDFKKNPRITIPPGSGQTKKNIHSTVDPEVNEITADMSILSMVIQLLRPAGVKVYVGSKNSRLFPELPHFDFRA